MKVFNLIFQLLICFISLYSVTGEYNIKDVVPSYLYRKFDNVQEDIFPQNIRINMSLSRISGILIYSIDRRQNQLIVSFQSGLKPIVIIEFRKIIFYNDLSNLCGCNKCRFMILDLKIKIRDKLSLQCNHGRINEYTFDNIVKINEAYPIPFSINEKKTKQDAYLWFVNFPITTVSKPNSEQLMGCIFDVWYNDKILMFSEDSHNINDKCSKMCTEKICNGGVCFETYNGIPFCNCTKTFLNGLFCNDTIYQVNVRSTKQDFQFPMFKVSWRNSSKNILTLINPHIQIILRSDNSTLSFGYNYTKKDSLIMNSTILQNYVQSQRYILIVKFYETFIYLQYFRSGSWYDTNIPSPANFGDEIFTTIILQSGDGVINFASKLSEKKYVWDKLHILKPENLKLDEKESLIEKLRLAANTIDRGQNICDTNIKLFNKSETMNGIILGLLIILLVIMVVSLVLGSRYMTNLQNESNTKFESSIEKNMTNLQNELNTKFESSIEKNMTNLQNEMNIKFEDIYKKKTIIKKIKDIEEFCGNQIEKRKELLEKYEKSKVIEEMEYCNKCEKSIISNVQKKINSEKDKSFVSFLQGEIIKMSCDSWITEEKTKIIKDIKERCFIFIDDSKWNEQFKNMSELYDQEKSLSEYRQSFDKLVEIIKDKKKIYSTLETLLDTPFEEKGDLIEKLKKTFKELNSTKTTEEGIFKKIQDIFDEIVKRKRES